MNTRRPSSGKKIGYVGSNTFADGVPVCKSVVPGRVPKALEGPVHPGFKGKPKVKKNNSPLPPTIVKSGQNNDIYNPLRKVSVKKKSTKK